jgi:hypothetical protein
MTRIIAASPLLTITRNDTITVTAGDYAGESGTVINIFRGMATVARDNDRWFTVPIGDCEKEEAVNCGDGLSTTHQTA